jgi:hypothetical protein
VLQKTFLLLTAKTSAPRHSSLPSGGRPISQGPCGPHQQANQQQCQQQQVQHQDKNRRPATATARLDPKNNRPRRRVSRAETPPDPIIASPLQNNHNTKLEPRSSWTTASTRTGSQQRSRANCSSTSGGRGSGDDSRSACTVDDSGDSDT